LGASSPLLVLLRKLRSAGVRLRRGLVSQRFGFSPSTIYGDSFYDGAACDEGRVYAAAVADILFDRYAPRTVFDFGCGQGAILAGLEKRGVLAFGCDGSAPGVRRCPPNTFVFQADLKKPLVTNRTFDLVLSIEVAEHLPHRSGPVLVASMAGVASHRVVFSASGPGSPIGDDHINLQPPEYWADLFAAHGFRHRAEESREVRAAMKAAGAPDWFQNTIVLER
jgi:SAM-dependent methyltransferase